MKLRKACSGQNPALCGFEISDSQTFGVDEVDLATTPTHQGSETSMGSPFLCEPWWTAVWNDHLPASSWWVDGEGCGQLLTSYVHILRTCPTYRYSIT